MGLTSTVFMTVVCYIGWWYQRLVRRRFEYAVEEMYIPPQTEVLSVGRPSTDRPDSPMGGYDDSEPLLRDEEALQGLDPVRLRSRGETWNPLMMPKNVSTSSLPLIRISVDGEEEGEDIRLSPLQGPKTH